MARSKPTGCVAVFVHGLFSAGETWKHCIRYLARESIAERCTFVTYSYASPAVRLNPLRRIPDLRTIADAFRTWLATDDATRHATRIVLVGHSLGGLVIQRYIATTLAEGRSADLRRIRRVMLVATPNTGSELFLTVRRWMQWAWWHPQEQATRPHDAEVAEIHRLVINQCVNVTSDTASSFRIPFDVYAADMDGIVSFDSARSVFPNAGTLPGDHNSVLRPKGKASPIVLALKRNIERGCYAIRDEEVSIQTHMVDPADSDEIDALIRLQHDRFAPDAQISRDDLRHWLENAETNWGLRLHVITGKVNGEVVGFIIYTQSEHHLVAGWIATTKGHQASQFVLEVIIRRLVAHSRELDDMPVVFEVEDPWRGGSEEAYARIRLFQRFGARVIDGLQYLAPNMDELPRVGAERAYLMMYGRPGKMLDRLPRAEVELVVADMYRIGYELWFSHRPTGADIGIYLGTLKQQIFADAPDTFPLVQKKWPSRRQRTKKGSP